MSLPDFSIRQILKSGLAFPHISIEMIHEMGLQSVVPDEAKLSQRIRNVSETQVALPIRDKKNNLIAVVISPEQWDKLHAFEQAGNPA